MSYALLAGAQLLGGILQKATAPKRPKVKPYVPPEQDIEDYLPGAEQMAGMETDMAMAMMRGEIPESVKDQIEMFAGERAMQGGYGATQGRVANMTARDLGLESLNIAREGRAYAASLRGSADQRMISDANMAFEAWSSNVDMQMASYRDRAASNANMWEAGIGAASTYVAGKDAEASDERYYALADRAISAGQPVPPKSNGSGKITQAPQSSSSARRVTY